MFLRWMFVNMMVDWRSLNWTVLTVQDSTWVISKNWFLMCLNLLQNATLQHLIIRAPDIRWRDDYRWCCFISYVLLEIFMPSKLESDHAFWSNSLVSDFQGVLPNCVNWHLGIPRPFENSSTNLANALQRCSSIPPGNWNEWTGFLMNELETNYSIKLPEVIWSILSANQKTIRVLSHDQSNTFRTVRCADIRGEYIVKTIQFG